MREIKFRAWNKVNEMMLEVGSLFFETGGLKGFFGKGEHFLHKSNYTLMQFTGLKDKNGKEIYEGDLLRDRLKPKEVYTVEYRDYCFCLKEVPNSIWLGALHGTMEVIGNIYENKDLLAEPK